MLIYIHCVFFIMLWMQPAKTAPTGEEETRFDRPTDRLCPEKFGLFPYPGSCTRFISCANGLGCAMECPPKTKFHPTIKVCTHERGNPCVIDLNARSPDLTLCPMPTTDPPIKPPPTPGEECGCEDLATFLFVDPAELEPKQPGQQPGETGLPINNIGENGDGSGESETIDGPFPGSPSPGPIEESSSGSQPPRPIEESSSGSQPLGSTDESSTGSQPPGPTDDSSEDSNESETGDESSPGSDVVDSENSSSLPSIGPNPTIPEPSPLPSQPSFEGILSQLIQQLLAQLPRPPVQSNIIPSILPIFNPSEVVQPSSIQTQSDEDNTEERDSNESSEEDISRRTQYKYGIQLPEFNSLVRRGNQVFPAYPQTSRIQNPQKKKYNPFAPNNNFRGSSVFPLLSNIPQNMFSPQFHSIPQVPQYFPWSQPINYLNSLYQPITNRFPSRTYGWNTRKSQF